MSQIELWTKIFNKSRGRFFTVVFRKNNGTLRVLNGKVGKVSRDSVAKEKYLHVLDVQKNGVRMVNLNTIREFRCAELTL